MDSGPEGDSFLAPRMLPAPEEGGGYSWPSNRMSLGLSISCASAKLSI